MSEAPTLVEAGRQQAAGLAVAAMYERHARTLYGLCRMLLRDPHEAEDALQATFLAAHGAMLRGSAPRDEAAWLATIARNECRGRIRDKMRAPTHGGDDGLESVPDPGPAPEEQLRDPEVSRALAQLPESQREAVVLHDVFGFKAREVGKVLGMSVPAVEALLFRGRRQLRLRLRPAHGALVVPVGVRDALTQAIPGFASSDAGAAVVGGAGLAGAGLLAKLAGAPAAAKVAAGVAAVATAGSVAVVETERARDDRQRPALVQSGVGGLTGAGEPITSGAGSGTGSGTSSDGGGATGSSGPGSGGSSSGGDGADDERRDEDDDAGDGGTRGSGGATSDADRDDDGGRDDDDKETKSGESRTSGGGSGGSGSGSSKDDDDRGGKGTGDDDAKTETTSGDDDDPDDGSSSSGSGKTPDDSGDPDDASGSGSDDPPGTDSGSGSGSGSSGSGSGSGGGTDDAPDDDAPESPDD